VQLRLRDGSRKVAKFNLTHTVRDVRRFIASAAPAAAGDGDYTLQLAGFPPEQLSDDARAVGDGLAGAVIIQR
jgi:UBX domain-containing protein 1